MVRGAGECASPPLVLVSLRVDLHAEALDELEVPDDPGRRALARRFPYAVFFDVEPERAVVMAIAHTSRRPGYWGHRVMAASGTQEIEECP